MQINHNCWGEKMIEYKKLSITSLDSYKRLNNYIEPTHIDGTVIDCLQRYIGLNCGALLIEYPYYEKDYLSNYYNFYAKQHNVHSKLCYRIHFFSKQKRHAREYFGYITLREGVEGYRIGASYLSPRLFIRDKQNSYMITAEYKGVVHGHELTVNAFPWMHQETDISVCAHVSMWSILRYYGRKNYGYRDALMGDIVESVRREVERKVPSHGLSVDQIADIFSQYSFSPMLRGDSKHKLPFFKNEILSYIESGIPVVAAINGKQHAVSVMGYKTLDIKKMSASELTRYKETTSNIVFYSSLATGIYVIDDNYMPYRIVDRDIPSSGEEIDYAMSEISHIVVPYCEKVLFDYHQIYESFMEAYTQRIMRFDKDTLICKMYIISSNNLKVQASQSDMNEALKEAILRVDMPKFVWCVDLGTLDEVKNGMISHRLIADTTPSTKSKDIWLLFHNRSMLSYRYDRNDDKKIELSIAPYKLECKTSIKPIDKIKISNTDIWRDEL